MTAQETNWLAGIRSARLNVAHGFIFMASHGPPVLQPAHLKYKPSHGMNVVICAWNRKDGELVALTNQSLN